MACVVKTHIISRGDYDARCYILWWGLEVGCQYAGWWSLQYTASSPHSANTIISWKYKRGVLIVECKPNWGLKNFKAKMWVCTCARFDHSSLHFTINPLTKTQQTPHLHKNPNLWFVVWNIFNATFNQITPIMQILQCILKQLSKLKTLYFPDFSFQEFHFPGRCNPTCYDNSRSPECQNYFSSLVLLLR